MNDEENNGIKETKKKKCIIRYILISILVVILLVVGIFFIKNKLEDANVKKMNNTINELSKERTDYVFVEINPSLVMTIKDNKVSDIACLNDDCMTIYNDINVKGKTINESIDIVYNVSKNKGFDTSNGVKVKTTGNVNIDDKDYITIEYINETAKNELLSDVKNNESIKNNNNDDYYNNLWNELKKDKDYDKVYTCNMNDSKELECYIILDTGINKGSYNTENKEEYNRVLKMEQNARVKIINTLKKFNFDVKEFSIYINNIEFQYLPIFHVTNYIENELENEIIYKNILIADKIDILDDDVCKILKDYVEDTTGTLKIKNGKCQNEDGEYILHLEKTNLLKPNLALNNITTELDSGSTENILEQYENIKQNEKEQKELENRIRKCISIIESKGFSCCDNNMNCEPCAGKDIDALKNSLYCHNYTDEFGLPATECPRMWQTFDEYCD